MNRKEAKDFLNNWLWKTKDRKTNEMSWPDPFISDVISIIVDITKIIFIEPGRIQHMEPTTIGCNIKIFAVDKNGNRFEIDDLYWFEENYIHNFSDKSHKGYTFELVIEEIGKKIIYGLG